MHWSNAKGKAAGVTGYTVNVRFGLKTVKAVTVKGASKQAVTVKVPKKYHGKKLSVRVCAYKAAAEGIQGAWSAARSVKVKR